ncbi:hypothetical protein RHSIM_Rhsim09G0192000 [Rhododendron simsii]|uniref:Uncharacterized protein n=1 Tax=Rhododendron simsii TaxID=118357 RepID=A0A834LDU2_RHOSS|nr:hypothetical protein RHSIM_Rhsim09G0192000 [Rhododendron simsii]
MDNVFRNVSDVLREERDMNMIQFLRVSTSYFSCKGRKNLLSHLGHLRDKNVGIVIREGRYLEMAQAKSKEKEKLISASKGKENAFPMV